MAKTNAERQREYRARKRNVTVTAPICAPAVTQCKCVRFLLGTHFGQQSFAIDVTMCTLHNAKSDYWREKVREYAAEMKGK